MNMKNLSRLFILSLLVAATVLGAGCLSGSSDESVLISGSTTVLPLIQVLSENYMVDHTDMIIVKGGGSGSGIAELIDKTNDIAMSSRKINDKELANAQSNGIEPVETIIAMDGITIIVNPSNPVNSLTLDQLQKIYTGEITNWNQVGGSDMKIAAIARDSASGTQEYFKEAVLHNNSFRSDTITQSATGAVTQEVSQNANAIGFIGAAYQDSRVKTLGINVNGTDVYPTETNILTGTYPLSRPLYLYTTQTPSNATTNFINYVMNPDGQAVVKEVGYAPVNTN
ncbi:PstS family phosphate ABC transporter substrate-binding protein [Methanolapillus millepedarum]|uniref:Phosphate-binding protein PstS 1 n=1 Tax=Methanolapillus millepedarum TaxID=3028296 RepID=A0AA96V2B5_9EURY|nr:Phosphate-binding protein PstS 1 [Methanosarcinaceae archaeon Ac7]